MENIIDTMISNVKLAREVHSDYTIPFDVSHIVLNALIQTKINFTPAEIEELQQKYSLDVSEVSARCDMVCAINDELTAEIEAMKAENERLKYTVERKEQEICGYATQLGLAQGLLAEPKKEIIDAVHKATINAYRQEIEALKVERDAAVQVIYSCPTCTNCIHMDECDDIGGRCEGRGFGSNCHEPLEEPHFQWRGVVE